MPPRSFLENLAGGPLTFGRFVQAIRLGDEMSLEAFANRLGVSRTNLSDIEQEGAASAWSAQRAGPSCSATIRRSSYGSRCKLSSMKPDFRCSHR